MSLFTKQSMAVIVMAGLISLTHNTQPAMAERGSTTLEGPGFQIENKKGWFGTSQKTYKDALGNTYVKKKGLFGRKSTNQSIFGSQVVQNGKNMTVLGPNGKPLIEKKKTWFHGEQTHINGTGILQNAKEIFQPATP